MAPQIYEDDLEEIDCLFQITKPVWNGNKYVCSTGRLLWGPNGCSSTPKYIFEMANGVLKSFNPGGPNSIYTKFGEHIRVDHLDSNECCNMDGTSKTDHPAYIDLSSINFTWSKESHCYNKHCTMRGSSPIQKAHVWVRKCGKQIAAIVPLCAKCNSLHETIFLKQKNPLYKKGNIVLFERVLSCSDDIVVTEKDIVLSTGFKGKKNHKYKLYFNKYIERVT